MKWPACEVCGGPVLTRQGVLLITHSDLDRYESEESEWEAKHPTPKNGAITLNMADAAAFPRKVHWLWGHTGCLPPDEMYWISANRLNTLGKALHWTLHLMGKSWFRKTDWRDVIWRLHKVPDA